VGETTEFVEGTVVVLVTFNPLPAKGEGKLENFALYVTQEVEILVRWGQQPCRACFQEGLLPVKGNAYRTSFVDAVFQANSIENSKKNTRDASKLTAVRALLMWVLARYNVVANNA
jgi:hypothetical protein